MIPFQDKKYQIIYADPPWQYERSGGTKNAKGLAKQHYPTMTTGEICAMPVRELCDEDGAALFLWATFPTLPKAIQVMEAWGFDYIGAAFVWIKKNKKSGSNYWGMGRYTRANAEVCLLGITPGYKATQHVISHRVHQIVEAPVGRHSAKPDEVRRRIVELLGDVPRIELFARERLPGWDVWGDEVI